MRSRSLVVGGWRGCRRNVLRPLIDPVVDRLVPELRVLGLEHKVAFVREVEHFRRDAKALQRGKELKAFADVKAVIKLVVYEDRKSVV